MIGTFATYPASGRSAARKHRRHASLDQTVCMVFQFSRHGGFHSANLRPRIGQCPRGTENYLDRVTLRGRINVTRQFLEFRGVARYLSSSGAIRWLGSKVLRLCVNLDRNGSGRLELGDGIRRNWAGWVGIGVELREFAASREYALLTAGPARTPSIRSSDA